MYPFFIFCYNTLIPPRGIDTMHTATTTHRTLRNSIIRALSIAALVTVSLGTLAACSDSAETQSEATGNADITSNWRYVSVTSDEGETIMNEGLDALPEDETPYFICDGTDFQLRVYEDHVGTGTVTANEDDTYTLDLNNSDTDVTAIIEGNTLDLVFPSGRMLTFEAE